MSVGRRKFLQNGARVGVLGLIGGLCAVLGSRTKKMSCDGACGSCSDSERCPEAGARSVWQIDPKKCTQCGRCATHCVLAPSAVKCVHSYTICGYCDLCGGYLRPDAKGRDTGAENQLCPVAAIHRTYIEDPYYQYKIDEALCIGCGICVKGCGVFGNGSMVLQVKHDLCVNCNECAIAAACPSDAFVRVPVSNPYLVEAGGAKV